LVAGLVAFMAYPAPLLAQGIDDAEVLKLLGSGRIAAARATVMSLQPTQVDLILFEGRVLKARGAFAPAIVNFREVLRRDPDHLAARRELAHTLLLNSQYSVARYHFDALMRIETDERFLRGHRYLLNVIDQKRPFGVIGHFSLLPSTNVNRGTTNLTFDTSLGEFVIDPSSQAESGIGIRLGASGFVRLHATRQSRLVLNWGVFATAYEAGDYGRQDASLALSYERGTKLGKWYASPFVQKHWADDDSDSDVLGLRFGVTHRLSKRTQLDLGLRHEERSYASRNYQSGAFDAISLQFTHQLKPSLSLNWGLGYEQSKPEAAHLKYEGVRAFAGLSKAWAGGLQTRFGFEAGTRGYGGDYPLTGARRDDRFYSVSVRFRNTRLQVGGVVPQLSCTHLINQSNIAFFDYKASECQLSVSRNF